MTHTAKMLNVNEFLEACRSSSVTAYKLFEELLTYLDAPATRIAARRFLAALGESLGKSEAQSAAIESFHFSIQTLTIGQQDRARDTLTLLQLPSVFAPEEWSRTFFEGLARFPPGEFSGRALVELGCGNGWISIALGRRFAPEKIYGLDVNPRAITCARINLYLNALTAEGALIRDGDGRSLLDRVEFHESDLLAWVRNEGGLEVDRVIGCIPQVLKPDLNAMEGVSDAASDEFLVSLSNYTDRQGYLEDQFGLGLVARALEEAIESMRLGGRVVFNLGGRPGRAILLQLFRRRGFEVREVWTTKIRQAEDTDINPLAEIETNSSHRFEFFLSAHSEEPVSARTAQAYARAGGAIYHSLTVFEAEPRFPEPVRHIFSALHDSSRQQVRSALDLGYEEAAVAEEKAAFLSRLADLFPERHSFPYEDTAGLSGLRRHLAEFLRRYFAIPLGAESLVALPNRACALRNFFTLYAASLSLVHPFLLRGTGLDREPATEVLECPIRVDLACKLMEALRPHLVVTTLDELDARTPDSFLRLVETAGRTEARLVVDISPLFELESTPRGNGVLQALAEAPLPSHVALLCGLVKNRVYRDLELCFLIAENQNLLKAMTNAAELTYSRVPLLTQEYYDTIITELVSFRLDFGGEKDEAPPRRPEPEKDNGARRVPLAPRCLRAFRHPAIVAEHLPRTDETVRLDYGENVLPSPTFVEVSLFEAFARRDTPAAEADPTPEVALFLRRRFGLNIGGGSLAPRIAFGLGVAPLFAALAESCAAEGGTFFFPDGAYGYFVAALELFGGCWRRIETRRENEFKVTPEELDAALAGVVRPWLYLNGPVVNPTGSVYGNDEMAALLVVAARHRARVVLDVLFSGLEFEGIVPWDLEPVLAAHAVDLIVLGGISKELAAGGLRFGFAWCHSKEMEEAIAHGLIAEPHATMNFAAHRIFAGLNRPTARTRVQLDEQRRTLARRAEELSRVLIDCGWEPLPSHGGLFLVARPTAYLGRRLRLETPEGEKNYDPLDSGNLSEAMFWAVDLLINNSRWTGINEHCRFVFSVEEEAFQEGLRRLIRFRNLVLE